MAELWDDDDRDPLIDACLAEILGGQRPPDLTERILATLRSSQQLGASASTAATNGNPVAPAVPVKHTDAPAPARSWRQILVTIAAVLLVGVGLGMTALYFASPKDPARGIVRRPPPRIIKSAPESTPEQSPETIDEPQLAQDATPKNNNGLATSAANNPGQPTSESPKFAVDLPKPNWPAPIGEQQLLADVNLNIEQGWQQNNLQPASLADDAVWCRRAFLRLIGRIPTVDELRRFSTDTSEDKHAALVDRLINHSEYADEYANHWATIWTSVLMGQNATSPNNLANREGLFSYLKDAIRQNKPLDRLAYELISATGAAKPGDTQFNGAVNFLLANHSEDRTAETSAISRVFLGQRLQCVQCHDHPASEQIAQASFWQFDALLRQLHVDRTEGGIKLVDRDIPDEPVYYEELDGYKRAAEPVLPNGTVLPTSGRVNDANRREILARFVSQSPELAEIVVNRTWSYFFGYGFTTPIDDLGPHNTPTHPQVLRELADQFAAHGFNHRHLTQWIALTDAFRRSSDKAEGNLADAPQFGGPAWFSRYYSRQIDPEAIFDSLQLMAEARNAGSDSLPSFLGQFNPNPPQDVHMPPAEPRKELLPFTGPLVQRAVSSENGTVLRQVIKSDMSPEEKVEHLFLAAVARPPQKNELELALKMINDTGAEVALQDIWWALLNSSEFILDH